MASLDFPLISFPVFHTVFKPISIWKIKYIHLIIPLAPPHLKRKKLKKKTTLTTNPVRRILHFSEHVKASRNTYYAGILSRLES